MKILFLGGQPPEKGGITSHLRDMREVLGKDYIGFDCRHRKFQFLGFLKLLWFLRGKQIDLISAYHLYPEGLYAFLTGKKYVLTVFGEMYTQKKKWWWKWVLQGAERLLATSKYCARPARAMGIYVVIRPYGVDVEHFKPYAKSPLTDVVFVGYIHPRMGIDCLRKACETDISLVLVGENGGAKVEYDELPLLYNTARIYVSCANTKAPCMGLAIKEAMACGLPVICADSGGVGEAVKHGINGLLFEADNDRELRKHILLLLNDPELAQLMGNNGRKMAEEQFDKTKQCKEILDVFNSLN